MDPDHKLRSVEALVLKNAVQKLQGEVAQNRADITKIRDEQIPALQFEMLGLVGRILKKIDAISQKLDVEDSPSERMRDALQQSQLQLVPPMREEQPSSPELMAEIAGEVAEQVYDKRKSKSLFVREEKRQRSRDDLKRDLRNAYIALGVAVLGAIVGAITTNYYSERAASQQSHGVHATEKGLGP